VTFAETEPTRFRLLAVDAAIPEGTTLCLRWRAAASEAQLAESAFGQARCLKTGSSTLHEVELDDLTEPHGALDVELVFGSATRGLSPIVSSVSVATTK